ncbi:hypothetical protein ACFX19_014209 [Malus domestica]
MQLRRLYLALPWSAVAIACHPNRLLQRYDDDAHHNLPDDRSLFRFWISLRGSSSTVPANGAVLNRFSAAKTPSIVQHLFVAALIFVVI